MLDRQRRGAEPRICRQEIAELVERRVAQPRQGYMRHEFARLGLEADADQRLLDLAAQRYQLGLTLDPDPESARPVAAEHAGAGELQRKAPRPQPPERIVDIGRDV